MSDHTRVRRAAAALIHSLHDATCMSNLSDLFLPLGLRLTAKPSATSADREAERAKQREGQRAGLTGVPRRRNDFSIMSSLTSHDLRVSFLTSFLIQDSRSMTDRRGPVNFC